ncbi:MAG TPA: DNA mismatch repair protein MutS [Firmicutes bacterium]|nr:DNA mismatch repair protein MutS [Candidatus Fermentithermobacillaceae bacterium]
MKDATPMMNQYRTLKARYKDALLFFRLGDFYEMFYEDAEVGSRELGIALTSRDAGEGKRAPMCGVPYHSVDDYIKVLIDKGYKVAICEQLEDPALAKGLVRRGVVRVITPGTYWEGAESDRASYIACIAVSGGPKKEKAAGLCACDLSTGQVLLAHFSDEGELPGRGTFGERPRVFDRLLEEMARLLPKECVLPDTLYGTRFTEALQKKVPGLYLSRLEQDDLSEPERIAMEIYGQDAAQNLKAKCSPETYRAFLGLLGYIKSTQMLDLRHLKEPYFYLEEAFLEMDQSTRRNLELTQRLQGGSYGSLAWALDRCCTAMGSRLLKQWIERPLWDASRIRDRLDAVDELYSDAALRMKIRKSLSEIRDLERLVTKIAYKSCNARDLVSLASSLNRVPAIKEALAQASASLLVRISEDLDHVPEVVEAIEKSIADDPPVSLTEGGIIRQGYSKEVDELRDLASGGKKWMLELEARERDRTGIKSLKVGYNRVFGYYIEVTKSNLDMVPPDYIRKQTLVSSERFVTPELKEKETAILGAEEKLFKEEYRLFCEIRDFVETRIRRIQKTAQAVAELDVLADFAEIAAIYGYVRPEVSQEGPICIKEGRHPVLERILPAGTFVPNDLTLDDKERVLIITGPNMGGKSTYCRQAALIVLMAQMGSFVPCKSCLISCVDRIFARVGAYDDLVLGQSTFMVEMSEVSRILKGATSRSLVILDEIGRGTSTFDGLSVAWAVVEHLSDEKNIGARALVATHYRELTLLSDLKPGIANYHVTVKRSGEDVIFLRKVARGVSEGSFGIDVAAMAGLPQKVVTRAREILSALEAEARRGGRWKKGILGQVALRSLGQEFYVATGMKVPGQNPLFLTQAEPGRDCGLSPAQDSVLSEIMSLDLDNMTPLEALHKLYELKRKLEEGAGLNRDGA